MNNNNASYKKGDYVTVPYDGEELTGKIISVQDNVAKIEVCLSSRRGENLLTDTISIEIDKINGLGIDTEK